MLTLDIIEPTVIKLKHFYFSINFVVYNINSRLFISLAMFLCNVSCSVLYTSLNTFELHFKDLRVCHCHNAHKQTHDFEKTTL